MDKPVPYYESNEYFRKYRRNNPDKTKKTNQKAYYKKKYKLTTEDIEKYEDVLPLYCKLVDIVNKIKNTDEELLNDILNNITT